MLVLDVIGLLAVIIVVLAPLHLMLRRRQRENRELSDKLEGMMTEVLAIGNRSDFNVRSKIFK
jgi:hypothetical protein